jgi:hypothetical protein
MHRGARMRMVVRTLHSSVGPKAGAVLAGMGLYYLVADAISIVDALVGPLEMNRPDVSVVGAVTYVAPVLLVLLAEFLGAPLFAGWLSGSRGGLYGLVTAVCLSFPETALVFRSLASIPPDSLGDLADLLPGGPWAAVPSFLPARCVLALCFLPTLAMLLLAWFGGYCGERVRLRRSGDSST